MNNGNEIEPPVKYFELLWLKIFFFLKSPLTYPNIHSLAS